MTHPPVNPDLLEAYLDGRLSGPDRAAVERAIGADPALGAQAAMQRSIDESIRRQFQPAPAQVPPAPRIPAGGPFRRWTWLAAAAAVLLTAGLSLWLMRPAPRSGVAGLYNRLQATNFKPQWVCATDDEFRQFVGYRLGQPLLARPDPAVSLIGWTYTPNVLGPQTITLMATVEGRHPVVMVDRLIRDHPMTVDPRSGLNIFRREAGSLVMYEVTPLPAPRVLDLLYIPEDVKPENGK